MIGIINIKKMCIMFLAVCLVLATSILSQPYLVTRAANTLPGNNEVINIATTDSLPINATIYPQGYSADGNVVLFFSYATNIPNNGASGGLYTYNIKSNSTARVDVSTSGVQANAGLTGYKVISETGRYVTFSSLATNLIDGSTLPQRQIYIRDTQAGMTNSITGSSAYSGGLSQNWENNLGISNDGRFALIASRYIASSYPYSYGITLGDGASGIYSWTSLGNQGYLSPDDMTIGSLSCDGAFAIYQKSTGIYIADIRQGTTAIITAGNSTSTSPVISCNGRYALYATTNRTDISPTPSGMNSYLHLVRYDRINGERKYIDNNSAGTSYSNNGGSYNSTPIPNAFNASITDMGDVVFKYDNYSYLKHLSDGSGTLESIGKKSNGTYVNIATGSVSADGRYIFFKADPYDLGLVGSPSSAQIIRAKTGV